MTLSKGDFQNHEFCFRVVGVKCLMGRRRRTFLYFSIPALPLPPVLAACQPSPAPSWNFSSVLESRSHIQFHAAPLKAPCMAFEIVIAALRCTPRKSALVLLMHTYGKPTPSSISAHAAALRRCALVISAACCSVGSSPNARKVMSKPTPSVSPRLFHHGSSPAVGWYICSPCAGLSPDYNPKYPPITRSLNKAVRTADPTHGARPIMHMVVFSVMGTHTELRTAYMALATGSPSAPFIREIIRQADDRLSGTTTIPRIGPLHPV